MVALICAAMNLLHTKVYTHARQNTDEGNGCRNLIGTVQGVALEWVIIAPFPKRQNISSCCPKNSMNTAICLSGKGCHDGISLENDVLQDLLFLGAKDFGKGLVELRLLLLHFYGKSRLNIYPT